MNTTNFDGQWTRRVIERLGYQTAQGSSTRGGLRGLAVMAKRLEEGVDAAFTIDGPRGPRYIAKPGPVMLARRSGRPIILFHIGLERAWTLKKDMGLVPDSQALYAGRCGDRRAARCGGRCQAVRWSSKNIRKCRRRWNACATSRKAWFSLTDAERERERANWNS